MYGEQSRATGPPLYPHNTYHGVNHHQRTPLAQANFKPLKFTDSPMMYPSTGRNPKEDENAPQDDEVQYWPIACPIGDRGWSHSDFSDRVGRFGFRVG